MMLAQTRARAADGGVDQLAAGPDDAARADRSSSRAG